MIAAALLLLSFFHAIVLLECQYRRPQRRRPAIIEIILSCIFFCVSIPLLVFAFIPFRFGDIPALDIFVVLCSTFPPALEGTRQWKISDRVANIHPLLGFYGSVSFCARIVCVLLALLLHKPLLRYTLLIILIDYTVLFLVSLVISKHTSRGKPAREGMIRETGSLGLSVLTSGTFTIIGLVQAYDWFLLEQGHSVVAFGVYLARCNTANPMPHDWKDDENSGSAISLVH